MDVLDIIAGGLPGSYAILIHITTVYNGDKCDSFFRNIISKKIFGSKLYFIWKNVCQKDYDKLIEHNFEEYDDDFFIDKV